MQLGWGLQDVVSGGSMKRSLCGTSVRVKEDVRVMLWFQPWSSALLAPGA